MKSKYLTVLILLLNIPFILYAQVLSWPEVTQNSKPWTRWWWPGSIVNQADLTAAMEKYRDAGLGGLEIAVIYGVKGQEDKFINYLSPEWMKMFTYTLKEGERLDLGIDLANASGWPFGGPWVEPADACKDMNYKIFTLEGGESLKDKVECIQQPLVRPVGEKPDINTLKYPISRNKNLQLYALDQIRFEKSLPLKALIAYSDSGYVVSLTGNIDSLGYLKWIAPPGNWNLYAIFQGWHGKMCERAGPGGEGDVIDHFSGSAVKNYLDHFDQIFKDYDIKSLHGYFNDSYEVDDASGQADWTNDLLPEFFLRRGYDLRNNFPALLQKDNPEKNARVLSDYRLTVSELLLEKFTSRWTDWAHRQGKMTRNQAHGSPGNILDLYAASDIPETEGSEITRLKFASSASNVTGKKLTSCEAGTWLNEHFLSNLSDTKNAADKFFISGVNHLFYHGTCFSPQNEPWPGFLFYAAVELTPVNPLWNDFSGLNNYITGVQSFLQQGMADNDVLLYFPIFDRFADFGKGLLEHFDGISPSFDGSPFKTAAESMTEKGYTWDYISDLQLMNTVFDEASLQTEGNIYRTLIVPGCKYIPAETFARVLSLANDGAKIIFYGDLPENISGWADMDEKTRFFDRLKSGINFKPTNNPEVFRTVYGKGMLLTGHDLNQLLSYAGVKRETMADNKLGFTRRETMKGFVYFITNQNDIPFNGWIRLEEKGVSAAIFNPMDGNSGIAERRLTTDGTNEIYTRLAPGESVIIELYKNAVKGNPYIYFDGVSSPITIQGNWSVEFLSGGPTIPAALELSRLVSWTETGNTELRDFSGTAKYKISFKRPAGKADTWLLDLGSVHESARIILNGKQLAVLIGPGYNTVIPGSLMKSFNTLEINVSNLMANRISYLDRNNIQWKKFYNVNMAARLKQNSKNGVFDASAWEPKVSGLLGPVTLTKMKKHKN